MTIPRNSTPTRTNLTNVLLGCAEDLEAFANDPGIVLAVADRLRRYVTNELGYRGES